MSKRENAATLYLYVKDYILKLLISGKYPAGSQIPTEYQLMQELNVGRATVRAALAQLEQEGTIYKRQGVGTFVSKRDKNFGLEPFISMSFMIKRLGLQDVNKILEQGEVKVSKNDLTEGWKKGSYVYCVKRLRFAEKTPIAIEYNYYSPEVYKQLNAKELDASLSHNLLANLDTEISKITSETIVRDCTQEEYDFLGIPMEEKVVQIRRWMYTAGSEEPATYLDVAIPTHVLEFPFLG